MTTQDYFIKDLADSVTGAIPKPPAPTATEEGDDPITTQALGEEGDDYEQDIFAFGEGYDDYEPAALAVGEEYDSAF